MARLKIVSPNEIKTNSVAFDSPRDMAIFVSGGLLSEKPTSAESAHRYGRGIISIEIEICRSPLACRTKKIFGTFGDHLRSLTTHVAFSSRASRENIVRPCNKWRSKVDVVYSAATIQLANNAKF